MRPLLLFLAGVINLNFAAAWGPEPGVLPEPSGGVSEEEVTLDVEDARLGGTLSVPSREGRRPAVLLLCGSGDQDRDWDIDGDGRYRMGWMLASALNDAGIAVLRMDDRGTGKSTGRRESLTSLRVLKQDALAALAFLEKDGRLGPVGIGGLSAGAEIATMVAAESKEVRFLVLLSAPFVSGEKILLSQAEAFPQAFVPSPPNDRDELIRRAVEFQRLCIAAARGKETGELAAVLRENTRHFLGRLPEEEKAKFPDFDAEVERHVQEILSGFQSDWYRSFVEYDPAIDLPRVSCPILAIYGERDNRVSDVNGWRALMRVLSESQSLSPPDLAVKVLPDANHFLTNREHALKGEMMPGLTGFLSEWILGRTVESIWKGKELRSDVAHK